MTREQQWDSFIEALDEYKEAKASWEGTRSRPGFYDPCGEVEQFNKEEIQKAGEKLDKCFGSLIWGAKITERDEVYRQIHESWQDG